MKKVFIITSLLLLQTSLIWPQSTIIARYDGGSVTSEDITIYMTEFEDYRRNMLIKYPNKSERDREVAKKIAYDRLLSREARQTMLPQNQDIKDRLQYYEQELLAKVYLQKNIVDPITVTEADTFSRYQERIKSHFTRQEQWTFRYIFFDARKLNSDDEIKRLYSTVTHVYRMAVDGQPFDELAKKYSSAENVSQTGGLFGPVKYDLIHPSIDSALRKLSENEISRPIRIPVGYQIVQLINHTKPEIIPFDEVKQKIIVRMKNELVRQETEKYLAEIKNNLSIIRHFEKLDSCNDSNNTILIQSRMTTLYCSDLNRLVQLLYPRRKRVSLQEKEQILNETVVRQPIILESLKNKVEQSTEYQRLYEFHRNDIYATFYETVLLNQKIDISAEKIYEYYKKNIGRYTQPREYLCQEIRIPIQIPDDAYPNEIMEENQKALELVENLHSRIQEGDDFDILAKEFSTGPTAKDGGYLNWMNQWEGGVQFQKAIRNLNKNEISEPVRGVEDILILKLIDIKDSKLPPFQTIKERVKQDYLNARQIEEANNLQIEFLENNHFSLTPSP